MKDKSPESQNFGKKKLIRFTINRFMRINGHLMRISKFRRMANHNMNPLCE